MAQQMVRLMELSKAHQMASEKSFSSVFATDSVIVAVLEDCLADYLVSDSIHRNVFCFRNWYCSRTRNYLVLMGSICFRIRRGPSYRHDFR